MGEAEELVYIDKKMLAACGIKRSVFAASGVKAARLLSDLPESQYPAFVFCTGLTDMESLHFLELIRLHPGMYNLPMIIVANQLNQQSLVEASRLGSCLFLTRPYTRREIENAVRSVGKEGGRLAPCADAAMFEQALESLEAEWEAREGASQSASLSLGRALLRQGKYRDAVIAFARHLEERQNERGPAFQGIAEAVAGLGLSEKSIYYLEQAAAAYIEEEDFMSARTIFARLHKNKREIADNPLYQAGVRLTCEGSYRSAVQAFMQGQMLTPEESFHIYAAQACQVAPNPEHCAERICWHLERRSPSLGRDLRSYLLAPENPEPEFESRAGLWGLLREVLEVARYTVKVNAAG